ncbi:MAG: methyl-accepting chemotaxis protein [Solibacillus sp.]
MKISTLLKTTATILCTLIIISGFNLFLLMQDIKKETEALKLDKEMEVLATQLQGASDYLTNEVRAYAQFGDQQHYENYWREVNETKTRDMVVQRLQELNVPSELLDLVELAQTNSNNLISLEERAMEAVANDDLPLARELVYGPQYAAGKEIIAEPLHDFSTQLQDWTATKIIETENAVTTKLIVLIISVLFVIIALAFTFLLLFKKIQPLGTLSQLAQQFASGDLTFTTLTIQSQDEVATLTQSFNKMATQLRDVLGTVNIASEKLAASSEELLAGTDEITSVAQQVNTAIEQVATDTSKQSLHIEESTIAIKEVLQGVQIIADSSSSIATSAENTTRKSHLGEEQITQAIDQMKSIEEIVKSTATSVEILSTRSKEIEEIITTISTISEQTNLLSLNASIEAARAGEQGKGFAVVADEVKKLAEQSSKSAQHIATIIQSIQQETGDAVHQMNDVTNSVMNGVAIIEQTGHSFTEILASSNEVTGKIQEMSAVSTQIATNTEQVVSSFASVNALSKNTTDQTYTVSSLAEEQLATMQEIAASTSALTELAFELNNELTKFKL